MCFILSYWSPYNHNGPHKMDEEGSLSEKAGLEYVSHNPKYLNTAKNQEIDYSQNIQKEISLKIDCF